MKKLITDSLHRFGIKSSRTKNITKHVLLSFLYKGGSIVCNFLLVPVTINYLDTDNYGAWITISSFIAWFSFFDIGLGNGLRNKFTEAKTNGDTETAKAYVSTAYFTIGTISVGLVLLFTLLNPFVHWPVLLNMNYRYAHEMSLLMPLVFGFFCIQLVAKLITTIYTADQHHSVQGKVNFYTQLLSLLTVWVLTHTTESTLLLFGTIYSAIPIILLIGMSIVAFNGRYKAYKPDIKLWNVGYMKSILGLGISFFIIQLSGIVIFSTDNVLVSHFFGNKQVVIYSSAYKYFSIGQMVVSMILAPFWSSVTDAYHAGEFDWIKTSMRNLQKLVFGAVFVILLMLFVSPYFYGIWLPKHIQIPFMLSVSMAIYFIVVICYMPYTFFLNGIGKTHLQMWVLIPSALLNIPVCVFLAIHLGAGLSGIILGSIVCLLPHAILSPIQFTKVINGRASGIWNR